MGPMTLEESLQIRNNRLSIPVTVSGIHSHLETSKYMTMYNLISSRGTITRTLTLQVTRNRQHDTSRPSVQPNHQDYVSATSPSFATHYASIATGGSRRKGQLQVTYFLQMASEGGHFTTRNKLLAILSFFRGAEGDGQRRPLVQVEAGRLMLPPRHRKWKWNVTSYTWYAKLGTLHTGINYLLMILSLVCGVEGNVALFCKKKLVD